MTAKKKYEPDKIILSEEDTEALEQRIKDGKLTEKDVKVLINLIKFNQWIQERLGRAKLTVKRLRQLFGFRSESKKKSQKNNKGESSGNDQAKNPKSSGQEDDAEPNIPEEKNNQNKAISIPNWDPQKNHGRYAANDYTGCPISHFSFNDDCLQKGKCPECAKCNTDAAVTPEDPEVLVFLKSQPLVSGNRYSFDKVRCLVCQTYFTAPLPDNYIGQAKYDYSCKTTIAINHYYAGFPFKRIETLQKLQGIPLADATQYDLMQQLYGSVIQPIAKALKTYSANGTSFFFDDTPGRILDQTIKNKQATSRKNKQSIHTTALLSEYEGHRIYLFNTNKRTAGKEFAELLNDRESDKEFISMSDASSHNFPDLEDNLLSKWIISLCLSHSRRKFIELFDDADSDIQLILEIIATVYHNEKHCKQKKLNDEQRLIYHQTHSEPRLLALKTWLNNLMLYKQVEPNSCLGEAIIYLLKRWHWLTQFLRVPGAALDNNICEQAIKVVIRYRKNSLFYKTFYGATIGDAMMSVLHTAACAKVNIFDYLNTVQIYAKQVNASPENWLPWNYQDTLAQLNTPEPELVNSA